MVGDLYARVLRRLEDPKEDGAGLREIAEGGILVPGVGKAGYDLSNVSEAWRRGYFEVLMGCAQAAEHLDDHVLDTKRSMVFKKEYLIGPSNPDPRPIPPWMHDAPLEENCQLAYDPPEKYYLKILTSTGFTTKQRLDAALAYGNWLDYKNLSSSAEEVYHWALDIATSALPIPSSSTIDPLTAVIHPNATSVTPNIIQAATSLAIHHASTSNLSAALPIFLSVLRARRAAPPPDPTLVSSNSIRSDANEPLFKQQGSTDIAVLSNYTRQFLSLFLSPTYPPPPPSGDEPLTRSLPADACKEAEIMTYIGEVLFASSTSPTQRKAGVRWTREAVEVAESADGQMAGKSSAGSREAREECRRCMGVGMENWLKMVRRLGERRGEGDVLPEAALHLEDTHSDDGKGTWRQWISMLAKPGDSVLPPQPPAQNSEVERWWAEEKQVEERLFKLRQTVERDKLLNPTGVPWAMRPFAWVLNF